MAMHTEQAYCKCRLSPYKCRLAEAIFEESEINLTSNLILLFRRLPRIGNYYYLEASSDVCRHFQKSLSDTCESQRAVIGFAERKLPCR
jgi:hypothetical protein